MSPGNIIFRLVLLLAFIPGIYFLHQGGAMLLENIRLNRTGVKVDAKVIGIGGILSNQGGRTGKTARNVYTFEFVDKAGKTVQVESAHAYTPHFEAYNEQGLMPIVYDPADPAKNRVNTFGRLWILPIFRILLGLCISFVGVMAFAKGKK